MAANAAIPSNRAISVLQNKTRELGQGPEERPAREKASWRSRQKEASVLFH